MSGYRLDPDHAEWLTAHAVDPDMVTSRGLAGTGTDHKGARSIVVMWTDRSGRTVPQFVYPERPKDYRYRFPKSTWTDKDTGRPFGSPPLFWLREPADGEPIIYVEGTKQCLAAFSWAPEGYGIVGTPGCDGHTKQDLSWSKDQTIIMVPDADVTTNARVHDAFTEVEALFREAGAYLITTANLRASGTDGLDDVLAPLDAAERGELIAKLVVTATIGVPAFRGRVGFEYDGPAHKDVIKAADQRWITTEANRLVDEKRAWETGRAIDWDRRSFNGADWLADEDEAPKPLWGTADTPLWLTGESLLIVGPPSVGKSTLSHAVLWGALGMAPSVLGHAIEPMTDGGILYLAMDRPRQIKRAMARFIRANQDRADEINEVLRDRLTIWEGPLPGDPTVDKRLLVSMAERFGRTRIVVDSIKDILPNASDEARAGGYNVARQEALAEGLEWVELHHNRKNGAGNKEPDTLDDVYGSRWLTAGAGSVLSLFGEPGDIVLRLKHIKPLGEPIFPTWVKLDRLTGDVSIYEEITINDLLEKAGDGGITVDQATRELFGLSEKTKLDKSKVESVRLKLKRLKDKGIVEEFEKINSPKRYRLVALPIRGM